MPDWVTYLTLALLAAVVVLLFFTMKGNGGRVAALEQELNAERQRANAMAGSEAQLKVVQGMLEQVQHHEQQLELDLREANGARAVAETELRTAKARQEELDRDLIKARGDLEQAVATARDQQINAATAASGLEAANQAKAELLERANQAERDRDQAREDLRQALVDLEQAQAGRRAAEVVAEQARQFVESARDQLKVSFAEAASKVFDEKSTLLEQRINQSSQQSKQQLEDTLKPFNEQLKTFRERVDTLNESQTKESANLMGALGEMQKLNQGMADTTDALTRALKGNAKIRGNWGEMILESVLQSSGLEEGTHFRRQASSKDEETGQRRQPDVVLTLPDGRQVVIDSKVNLIAWSEAHDVDDGAAYHEALKRHAAALRVHVKDLADKNYPKVLGGQVLDVTVLFVPIEGALSAALSTDPQLQTDAWKSKVVFASPNTLMAMLQVVERLWVRDRLQKQVGIIGDEAGKLVDSLIAFLSEFKAIESKLQAVQSAYTQAGNRLSESPQSVIQRAKRLVAAGAKGRKMLPDELVPEGEALPLLVDETGE